MRQQISQSALGAIDLREDGCEKSFRFEQSFVGFAGHFPDYPILPAILQTLLGQLLAEEFLGTALEFVTLERARFTRQLRPEEVITVVLCCRERSLPLRCQISLRVGEEPAASFTLVLRQGAEQ